MRGIRVLRWVSEATALPFFVPEEPLRILSLPRRTKFTGGRKWRAFLRACVSPLIKGTSRSVPSDKNLLRCATQSPGEDGDDGRRGGEGREGGAGNGVRPGDSRNIVEGRVERRRYLARLRA